MKTYTVEQFRKWGAKGGAKSKRKLTRAQAKHMVEIREQNRVKAQPPALPESKKELRSPTPDAKAKFLAALGEIKRNQV